MTTISSLVDRGVIIPITVALDKSEQPMRLLYATPTFIAWLGEQAKSIEKSPIGSDLTPIEQIESIFYTFVSGKPLVYSRQFRFIRSEPNAVWELKTPDTRIFGWFMMKDCFVAVFGDWADKVKDHDLYRGYRLEIRRLRRELGIEKSLCVTEVDPSEVLSL
ncbi:hypothetical protein [Bosea sp. BK604]|uniref:hypothetical protein n=1 Tax=Bosea sp. BK604 TaxID=2512180 RepID=UPI00104DB475|nr:hypothetical protein [Bosea sp. BK604]